MSSFSPPGGDSYSRRFSFDVCLEGHGIDYLVNRAAVPCRGIVGRFYSTAKLKTQFEFVLGDTGEFKFNQILSLNLFRKIPMNMSFSISTSWKKSRNKFARVNQVTPACLIPTFSFQLKLYPQRRMAKSKRTTKYERIFVGTSDPRRSRGRWPASTSFREH